MGSWGYGPYDNDNAADWFCNLDTTGIYVFIEKGLNSNCYQEQRAAAWMVQRLAETAYVYSIDKIDEHRKLAVEKLQAMLKDSEWINDWRNPDKIVSEIKKQIDEIENPNASPGLMEKICGCCDE